MEPSAAQTFADWTTGATAIVTAVAVVIGGGWALWRYVLPGPFGVDWRDDVSDYCRVRRATSGQYVYTAEVGLTNMSKATFLIEKAAICVILPPESPEQEPPMEVCQRHLAQSEFPVDVDVGRCAPNRLKPLPGSLVDVTFSSFVIVAWRIWYKRPKWFGLIGHEDAEMGTERYLPVDAESIRLYRENGEGRQR